MPWYQNKQAMAENMPMSEKTTTVLFKAIFSRVLQVAGRGF
jgi:hypothetical protein